MAAGDYRSCDVCNCKVFYDANLNYEFRRDWQGAPIPEEKKCRDTDYKLDYLGDWAVICTDCAKTHKTIVVPITE